MILMPNPRGDSSKAPQGLENDYFEPLADEVRRLAREGKRRLLVTSSGAGEGKSTITASLGRALSRSGRMSVVLVDTDQMRPTLHTHFGLENQHGLAELLEEIFAFDPTQEDPQQFGLGDWLELLSVEGRSGRLSISQEAQSYGIVLHKGVVVSIVDDQPREEQRLGQVLVNQGRLAAERLDDALRAHREVSRPLGDVLFALGLAQSDHVRAALRTQFEERLRGILMMRRPSCAFVEAAEGYLAASSGRHAPTLDGIG